MLAWSLIFSPYFSSLKSRLKMSYLRHLLFVFCMEFNCYSREILFYAFPKFLYKTKVYPIWTSTFWVITFLYNPTNFLFSEFFDQIHIFYTLNSFNLHIMSLSHSPHWKWLWKWSKNAFLISFTYVILMSFISKHKISLFLFTCSHTRGNILFVSPSFSHLYLAFYHWKLQLRFKSLCIIIESYL